MTRRYWEQVGGTLIEEFPAVRAKRGEQAGRWIDGVILLDGPREVVAGRTLQRGEEAEVVRGQRVVVVQTKAKRLCMYLSGQVILSKRLLEQLGAEVVQSVALVQEDDAVIGPLLREHAGCDVVVLAESRRDRRAKT
jgi:hypothetical protein